MQSPEKIREMTLLREKIEQKIDAAREDLLVLEESLEAVDMLLKQSSFTKASSMQIGAKDSAPEAPKPDTDGPSENIPMTNTADGRVIANAYLTPERLSIVLDDGVNLDENTPPFQTYFLDKVMADMRKKDAENSDQDAIDYTIKKAGSAMREIIVKNYRSHQRAMEIINTATWSLSKMIENTSR